MEKKKIDKLFEIESEEQLADFARIMSSENYVHPPDDEIPGYVHNYMQAVGMQRMKLVGIVWFDNEMFPFIPGETVNVTVNPDAILEDTKEGTRPFHGIPLTVLVSLTNKLEKPQWAKNETDE